MARKKKRTPPRGKGGKFKKRKSPLKKRTRRKPKAKLSNLFGLLS